jgi:hypothetical protein
MALDLGVIWKGVLLQAMRLLWLELGQDLFPVFRDAPWRHENASFSPWEVSSGVPRFPENALQSQNLYGGAALKPSIVLICHWNAREVDTGALQPVSNGQEWQRSAKDQQRFEELERQRQDLEQQNQRLQEQVEELAKQGTVPRCSQ